LDPGETITCTFTDTQRGKIIVDKVTDPSGSDQLFDFDASWLGADVDFQLADGTTPFDSGYLVPGDYSVAEVNIPGDWDLTNVSCNDDDGSNPRANPASLVLDPGETITCTFENTERGMVTVLKTVEGGLPNGEVFHFEIRKDASVDSVGTVVAKSSTDPVTGVGEFQCDAGADPATCQDVDGVAKLPPGDYQFCETSLMPGWMTSLSDDALFPGNFVPGSADPMVDNSIRCVPFTLGADETVEFSVDNTPPPGGDARTPGFWKNWSSVTGGNQEAVLDATIDNSPFMDSNGNPGFWVGMLFVDNVEDAYYLLSKQEISGNHKKRANDAAYEAAAFLLTAQLNVNAFVPSGFGEQPARQCTVLLDGIQTTQDLLYDIGFDGTGTYLEQKGGKDKDPNREIALEYAKYLDLYANNEPGPWSCLEDDAYPDN
jgi:hypothetical protein